MKPGKLTGQVPQTPWFGDPSVQFKIILPKKIIHIFRKKLPHFSSLTMLGIFHILHLIFILVYIPCRSTLYWLGLWRILCIKSVKIYFEVFLSTGEGRIWQTHPPPPPGRPPDGHCSGRDASYWNAFLSIHDSLLKRCLQINTYVNMKFQQKVRKAETYFKMLQLLEP